MRVAITTEQLRRPVPGGIGTYIRGLLKGLRDRADANSRFGLDVSAVTVRTADPRLPVRVVTSAWDGGFSLGIPRADVLHATTMCLPRYRPSTVFVHDLAWRASPEAFTARGRRWHEAAFVRAVARSEIVIVPSHAVAEALQSTGVSSNRIRVVPEGADHLPLRPRTGRGEFVLTVSTLEPRKNIARLIEAHTLAKIGVPLCIVGPTGWGDIDACPREGVVWLGRVSNERLSELLAEATAFAYVPLHEGFGLPPVEALRAGVPVLTSTTVASCASAPVVRCDPLDVESIAAGLREVGGPSRDLQVDRGIAFASALTWADVASAHTEIWRELV